MNKSHVTYLLLLIGATLGGCGADSFEDLKASGQGALEKRQFAEARGYFRQALALDNKDRDLLLLSAQACREDFLYDSAMYFLKRADLMHPGDLEIKGRIKGLAIALGDWQNAIDAIEAMARAGDTSEHYHEELTDLRMRNGQPGRAFWHARRAVASGSENPSLFLQTATWAANYDSLQVAIEILDSAISKFGPQDQFVVNKAMLLAYDGQYRKAEGMLRPIIAQTDPPNPSLVLNLANILAGQPERSKKEEAISLYEEIRPVLAGAYPIDSLIQQVRRDLEHIKN
jgi:Flp pilus assembly protein TadD